MGNFNYPSNKCKNCQYCKKLNLFKRTIVTIGPKGIITGLKIKEIETKNEEGSLCCVVFYEEDKDAPIYETSPEDLCERFKPRIIEDFDKSSMYDSNMIQVDLKPKSMEKFAKIIEDAKKD